MKSIIWVGVAFAVIGCGNSNENLGWQWDSVVFNDGISDDSAFMRMDKDAVTYPGLFSKNANTSNVRYTVGDASFRNDPCVAYCCKADSSLKINLGLQSHFGGSGFMVIVLGKKFRVQPYAYDDLELKSKKETHFTVVRQKLSLNKIHYLPGDSVYGKIQFDITENDKGLIRSHIAKGFFRTKADGPRQAGLQKPAQ